MTQALIAGAVLLGAAIIGMFLKPNADQTRPISPEPVTGHAAPEHGHHH